MNYNRSYSNWKCTVEICFWSEDGPGIQYGYEKDIDMQKIYYLFQLLNTGFDFDLQYLHIDNGHIILYPEFLVKLNLLKKLKWPQGIDIPELPSSLEKINQYNDRWTQIINLIGINNNKNSYRETLDKITKGKIIV